MKKTTATAFLFVFVFALAVQAHAQLRFLSKTNSDVQQALEKVLSDFPQNFSTLKGEVRADNPQTVEYASQLTFASAEENSITEYTGTKPVYSWQALMLTAEDFAKAEQKYNSLYKDLKSLSLTLNRDYTYSLSGKYAAPSESLGFATTVFQLRPNATQLSRVKVELSMQYEFPEWKVYLLVYQKEREDNERGRARD